MDWRNALRRDDCRLAVSVAMLTVFSLRSPSQSEATIFGDGSYCDWSGESTGASLLIRFGSRWTRNRWLTLSRVFFSSASFSSANSAIGSFFAFIPPRESISLRTAVIQESISSALSSTKRKLLAARLAIEFCRRNFDSIELFGPGATVPSSLALCNICRTQCFPGMRSDAKAADSFPSFNTFSGCRSKWPSPAYCSTYPDVTKT
jgi:hypothetical protein